MPEALRVVEVVPTLGVGGAERMATLVATGLRGVGVDVTVLALGAPTGSWIEAELAAAGVPVRAFGKGGGFEPRVVAAAHRAVRALRPHVVHTHLHVLKYVWPVDTSVVHTLHNVAEHEAVATDRRLQQVAFRFGAYPVAIGDAVAESVRRVYGLAPTAIIPNGIPLRPSPLGRDRARAELGLPVDAPVFLFAGRLDPQKDPVRLVEVAGGLPDVHLLVAGDGPLRDEVARHASAHVHVLGVRADMPRLLAACDAFVLPSRWEGNPLVVMEAMAAERAVFASAVGCVPELVLPGTGGLLPVGDDDALRAALRTPRAELHALGAAAGAASPRFDAERMVERYHALFERLRTERPSRRVLGSR